MKKIFLTFLILTLISCNELTKDVENSFTSMGIKLDSLNKIEESKIETYFNRINSKRIKKYDGENSALIYYSTIKHNRIVDSLIVNLKLIGENEIEKKNIVERFKFAKTDLKYKLNTITEFNTKTQIDSLLKMSDDIEILPSFAIITEFQTGKLNATKSAELLLKKLRDKIE